MVQQVSHHTRKLASGLKIANCDFSLSSRTQITQVWPICSTRKSQSLNSQSTLKSQKRNCFTTQLKPGLRYRENVALKSQVWGSLTLAQLRTRKRFLSMLETKLLYSQLSISVRLIDTVYKSLCIIVTPCITDHSSCRIMAASKRLKLTGDLYRYSKSPFGLLCYCRLASTPAHRTERPVLGIRREERSIWERRAPLSPKEVQSLVSDGVKVRGTAHVPFKV